VSLGPYKNILFVDFESTGKVDLSGIPADVFVPFFFGASQKSVPTEFLRAALKLGDRFLPINIEGHGKNALDFHIAFYLGEYLAANRHANCIILSKDKGFDPLVKHLRGRGFAVRRAATVAEAFGGPAQKQAEVVPAAAKSRLEEPSILAIALKWLKDTQPRARPRKRKGLIAYLHTRSGKKIPEAELHALIERMLAEKKLSEADGALGYHL
jgi:hypothetical protein